MMHRFDEGTLRGWLHDLCEHIQYDHITFEYKEKDWEKIEDIKAAYDSRGLPFPPADMSQLYNHVEVRHMNLVAYVERVENEMNKKLERVNKMQAKVDEYRSHLAMELKSDPKLKDDDTFKAKSLAVEALSAVYNGSTFRFTNHCVKDEMKKYKKEQPLRYLSSAILLLDSRLDGYFTRFNRALAEPLSNSMMPSQDPKKLPKIYNKSIADVIGARRYRLNVKDIGPNILKGLAVLLAKVMGINYIHKRFTGKQIHERLFPVTGQDAVNALKEVIKEQDKSSIVTEQKHHKTKR